MLRVVRCRKYLNGHCDVVAGALFAARHDELWERIAAIRAGNGAILGSFEARGMRTLHLRVERCCRTAPVIAEHFVGHRRIIASLYPGLPNIRVTPSRRARCMAASEGCSAFASPVGECRNRGGRAGAQPRPG
jgi:cystathionine beta-lyase/cystathionine gamma-synthase